jgi:hypothetical protein
LYGAETWALQKAPLSQTISAVAMLHLIINTTMIPFLCYFVKTFITAPFLEGRHVYLLKYSPNLKTERTGE